MIYFVQPVDGGPVKIGCSGDVESRVKQLESHYGIPLVLLMSMPGDMEDEREIHRRFAHIRLGQTEQFQPTTELMDFLGRPLIVNESPVVEPIDALGRPSVIHMKGSPEYVAWLDAFHEKTHIPKVQMVRLALVDFAKKMGHTSPPEI